MNKYLIITASLILWSTLSYGQEVLLKSDAVAIALENNFDISIAKTNQEIADNNASLMNSGYLPNVSANAGSNYSNANSDLIFSDSLSTKVSAKGIETSSHNASLGVDYILFDGLGRMYDYKVLKTNYQLSELQARLVIENSLLNIFNSYYEIARLSENELSQKETLDISRDRLKRAIYSAEYGQSTQLDVLNAEVDYNTDSIDYLTIKQQLKNEKRNLNLLMGRSVNIDFAADTTLSFDQLLDFESIESNAKTNNSTLLQEQNLLLSSEYRVKGSLAPMIPKVGLNGSYGWNKGIFGPGNPLQERAGTSLNLGASLTWNIFDGGRSLVQRQNTRLAYEQQQQYVNQAELNLDRQLGNAWTVYTTALFVMDAQKKNQQTNELNFDRSKEQHDLGQITNIVFRQAQFNLLSANLDFNRAKYSAKIAELALLQLSGTLLNTEF
ncbi:MAG: TolC family protein [Reichenbachiella sp.]